jgi:hypothetical protein
MKSGVKFKDIEVGEGQEAKSENSVLLETMIFQQDASSIDSGFP